MISMQDPPQERLLPSAKKTANQPPLQNPKTPPPTRAYIPPYEASSSRLAAGDSACASRASLRSPTTPPRIKAATCCGAEPIPAPTTTAHRGYRATKAHFSLCLSVSPLFFPNPQVRVRLRLSCSRVSCVFFQLR